MIRVLMELRWLFDTYVLKSARLLGDFTFFAAFFLDFIESKPFSYRHFRLFQPALLIEKMIKCRTYALTKRLKFASSNFGS